MLTRRLSFFASTSLFFAIVGCQQAEDNSSDQASAVVPPVAQESAENTTEQPNIVLIIVDDMGYTDIGAFGSEIDTPNLDRLANAGVKLTNYHASPQCAPTRSILMSGSSNHTAGMGSMFGDQFMEGEFGDRPGYEGFLHPRVATLPERLGEAGYNTYMVGKWHLGNTDETKPTAKGFDKAFALMNGGSNHMAMLGAGTRAPAYRENGEVLDALPDGFYSTNTYTDKIIEYIASGRESKKPFFSYVALTAPHWPHQVPEEYQDIYAGRYDEGYDVLRAERVKRAEELGVVPTVDPELFDIVGDSWDDLTPDSQKYYARMMEIYAAQIKNMDDNIGRLTTYLDEIGELDNTFFFFMSDNGAEADSEANPFFGGQLANNPYYDNSYENIGNVNSWVYYGPGWAQAAMAPYRLFKGFLTEGGTLVSAFASHPSLVESGVLNDQYLTVMDLMPTLLDLADAEFDPTSIAGRDVLPMQGRSFTGMLSGSDEMVYGPEDVRAFELHGQRSLLKGDWKVVWEQAPMNIAWYGDKPENWRSWRLFNLANDPTEQFDLKDTEPEKFAELVGLWDKYAIENHIFTDVVLLDELPPLGMAGGMGGQAMGAGGGMGAGAMSAAMGGE